VISAVSLVLSIGPTTITREAKLRLEVRHLQEQLKEERAKRGQTSEEMLHEARQWITELQHSVGFLVAVRGRLTNI